MIKKLLFGCLKAMLDLVLSVKTRYKYRIFTTNARVGKNLMLCDKSNCAAERRDLIQIGDHCEICGRLESQGEGKIRIGDYTGIYHNSVIGSVNSVEIGSYVLIANHVHIYDNNNHPVSPAQRKEICLNGFRGEAARWTRSASAPVVIEDNAWIGEYAAILKGVRIGKGAIVASHAVVTKDVPPYTIVAGNPARVVKTIENDEK